MSNNEQLDAVTTLTIGQLRKAANVLGIKADKTWRTDDFIEAIQEHQRQGDVATAVFDASVGPKPGYARVIIHRDPTPNHANGPVHLALNGRILSVPRGGEFDIPTPYVNVLKDAVATVTRESGNATRDNPSGLFVDEQKTSYPFQVVAVTPGAFKNPVDGRAAKYARRKSFFDKYGAWPTDAELKEYEKVKMRKDLE